MSWRSTRLVLIISYAVVAVMFISVFAFLKIRAYTIDKRAAETVISVLNANQIYVEPDVDISEKHASCSFSLKNASYSKDDTARKLLGENFAKVSDNEFEKETRHLRITGSRLLFEDNRDRKPIEGSVDINEESHRFLSKMGFDKNTYAAYNINLNNGIITFDVVPKYKKYWVHGAHFCASADREGIFYLEGTWFEPVKGNSEKITFCKISSAISNLIYVDDIKGKTIDKIYANYYITEDAGLGEIVTPVPMYTVICTDGSEYKFDASDAMLYTNN